MRTLPRLPWWPAVLLALLGLSALYAGALRTGFLNDDFLFLEQARTRPLLQSLGDLGPLANYYRPLARQVYFAALTPIAGDHPLAFHLFNFAVFLAALALLADLLRSLLPVPGVLAGLLFFALLPFQEVNLTWVSCSQDLLALACALGAVALHRRGRTGWAAAAYLAAAASKETALPLPAVLLAWELWVARRPTGEALRRLLPAAAAGVAWVALALIVRARHAAPAAFLTFAPGAFAATLVHEIQSLLGLGSPGGLFAGLAREGPALLPWVLLGALALWLDPARSGERTPTAPPARPALRFAVAWLVAFGLVVGPVVRTWSAYYYTLAGVGGAILVGLAARRVDRWAWIALCGALLWWHAGSTATRAFAIADGAWGWTSHLTSFYFRRAAALTDTLSHQMLRLEPSPPRGTRYFFALLPPWAGFQMGNGPLLRALYRDPTIESYFYSQFSESTAAGHPCRFLYWDGADLRPLYSNAGDPFFLVGCDLLLLDRPAGASYAFQRALEEGGERMDNLYWLGWAELWRGRRDRAEAAWKALGARDDSLRWSAHMRAARNALRDDRDTLETRRHLITAIQYGIGRPEGHAVLGQLMARGGSRYGLLELKVASRLNPRDWLARRDLTAGLVDAHLDGPAARELEALERIYPEWPADSVVTRAARTLRRREAPGESVARF